MSEQNELIALTKSMNGSNGNAVAAAPPEQAPPPIYESTATLDIDRQAPAGIIGQDAVRMPTNDADQFMATQIKTIQSDSVLRPVVQQFKLPVTDTADAKT